MIYCDLTKKKKSPQNWKTWKPSRKHFSILKRKTQRSPTAQNLEQLKCCLFKQKKLEGDCQELNPDLVILAHECYHTSTHTRMAPCGVSNYAMWVLDEMLHYNPIIDAVLQKNIATEMKLSEMLLKWLKKYLLNHKEDQ